MPKFVIEREIPGAGAMTDEEIRAAAIKSVEALNAIGPQIQWLHSYITANKVYASISRQMKPRFSTTPDGRGFPANRVSAVRRLIDATAAE